MIDIANATAQQKDPNFDVRKNLIGNLGDDWISYQKAPAGNTLADLNTAPSLFLFAAAESGSGRPGDQKCGVARCPAAKRAPRRVIFWAGKFTPFPCPRAAAAPRRAFALLHRQRRLRRPDDGRFHD